MLGIDVSKDHLTCALLDPATRKFRWTREFPNDRAGLQRLLRQTPPDVEWVVEPTGRYSSLAVELGTAAGRRVLMAQPKRAQLFLASLRGRLKTDRVDSQGPALYGLTQPLPPFPQKTPQVERLEQLQSARRGLAQSITRLSQQLQELPHASEWLEAALESLTRQRDELDTQIATLLATEEAFQKAQRLQEVPGIGPVTAAAVAAVLSSRNFETADHFVSYIGLAIATRQSGKWQGQEKRVKHGDAELRRLFYLAAQSNLRCKQSPFKDQYHREKAKGLKSTAALCSVGRKLARLCWSMWKRNSRYDPARVHVQPQEFGGQTDAAEKQASASSTPPCAGQSPAASVASEPAVSSTPPTRRARKRTASER